MSSDILDLILITVLTGVVVISALVCARRERREKYVAMEKAQEDLRRAS